MYFARVLRFLRTTGYAAGTLRLLKKRTSSLCAVALWTFGRSNYAVVVPKRAPKQRNNETPQVPGPACAPERS